MEIRETPACLYGWRKRNQKESMKEEVSERVKERKESVGNFREIKGKRFQQEVGRRGDCQWSPMLGQAQKGKMNEHH